MAITSGKNTYWTMKRGLVQPIVTSFDFADRDCYDAVGTTIKSLHGSNSGVLTNSPTFLTERGGCIDFDGTNDHILLNSTITFGNGNWTVIMWANTDSVTTNTTSLMSNSAGGPVTNAFGFNASKISYSNYDANPGWKTNYGNTTLSTGVWYMLGWVNYAGASANLGTMKMFVNGSGDSSIFNSYTTNGGPCNAIGNRYGTYYNGRVANFQYYNVALTDDQILKNYNQLKARFGHGGGSGGGTGGGFG